MNILHHLYEIPENRPVVFAVGFFDGFHVGHLAILERARGMAKAFNAAPGLLTFCPHPASVLRPERPVELLQSEEEKEAFAEKLGFSLIVLLHPTKEFLAEPAESFLKELAEIPGLCGIVCGENFTFGAGAMGNSTMLSKYFAGSRIHADILPLQTSEAIDGRVISSTEIRSLLKAGNVERAAILLGRRPSLSGDVVHGFRRGTEAIGFPTANLAFGPDRVLPKDGVYAVYAEIGGQHYPAVTNIGKNPTFGNGVRTVETFILDFDNMLYGKPFRIEFVKYLRGEVKFSSIDSLKKQIEKDIEAAKNILA